jgi:hypothetical protein
VDGCKIKLDIVRKRFKRNAHYVTQRFIEFSAGLKSPWSWIFAPTPFYAISRSNWSPESVEVRSHFLDAPREDGSWFRTEPDCSQNINNPMLHNKCGPNK